MLLLGFASIFAASPALAYAPGPGNGSTGAIASGTPYSPQPNAKWLAAKNAYRVHSGVRRGQGKGVASSPYVSIQPQIVCCGGGQTPIAYTLSTAYNAVVTSWEPSDGNYPNAGYTNGQPSPRTDDAGHYYNDRDFFDAWQVNNPQSGQLGIMHINHYPSQGVTLQSEANVMNWEASNRNTSTWQNYFYVVAWWNQNDSATLLHNDIVNDAYNNNVPVVAEVNAAMLPNWNEYNQHINHSIAIIGYDDNAGIYYYLDTCGSTTNCNTSGNGTDGQIKSVPQATMWDAIINIPVSTSTGDGGWVW